MVHHYSGVTSAYSPAELVEIRKQLRRENAELRNRLEAAQDWVNKSADKLEAAEQEIATLNCLWKTEQNQYAQLEAQNSAMRQTLDKIIKYAEQYLKPFDQTPWEDICIMAKQVLSPLPEPKRKEGK